MLRVATLFHLLLARYKPESSLQVFLFSDCSTFLILQGEVKVTKHPQKDGEVLREIGTFLLLAENDKWRKV